MLFRIIDVRDTYIALYHLAARLSGKELSVNYGRFLQIRIFYSSTLSLYVYILNIILSNLNKMHVSQCL